QVVQDLFRFEFCQQRTPVLTGPFNQRMAGHSVSPFLLVGAPVSCFLGGGESNTASWARSTRRDRRGTDTPLRTRAGHAKVSHGKGSAIRAIPDRGTIMRVD